MNNIFNLISEPEIFVPPISLTIQRERSFNISDYDITNNNIIMEGDNLLGLASLLDDYESSIKCVYIDPPYNTKDSIKKVYKDNLLREEWINKLSTRLSLLYYLLSEEGIIYISIDDNEYHILKAIMDSLFGEENFIANLIVVSNLSGRLGQKFFSNTHEYCLVYAKNKEKATINKLLADEENLAQWLKDEKGYYKLDNLQRGSLQVSKGMMYPIFVNSKQELFVTDNDQPPDNQHYTEVWPKVRGRSSNSAWRWTKQRIQKNIDEIVVKEDSKTESGYRIYSKQRPALEVPTIQPKTLMYKPEYSSSTAYNLLSQIFPKNTENFKYSKSVHLLMDLIHIATPNDDDIVLDCYAGSGTTGHAVLALNKRDKTNKRFILIEKEKYSDTIAAERIRRIDQGIKETNKSFLKQKLNSSFLYCSVEERESEDEYQIDNSINSSEGKRNKAGYL